MMQESTSSGDIKGMQFPCAITVKVFVKHGQLQTHEIHSLVMQVIDYSDIQNIHSRASSSSKYLAYSVEVYARSKVVIDDLFRLLSGHPKVIMVI